MSYLSDSQVAAKGFRAVGKNTKISSLASFHNCANISIGDNVRIDDFTVLSAGSEGIEIGNYIHIAVFCSIIGAAKIELHDFSNLSSRVSIYSSSDDYSGESMTNPTVPAEFKNVHSEPVIIGRHVIIGSGSVILPGVTLDIGVAVGALSLISKSCTAFGVYAGAPAKLIKSRKRALLDVEQTLLQRIKDVKPPSA